MRAEVLNAFIAATVEVLRATTGFHPRRGKPRIKGADAASYDVSGVVGLTGHIQGLVVLSFREAPALEVVGRFLGEPVDKMDEQVLDAVGELSNILAGAAKKALVEADYDLKISIPSVIRGRDHRIWKPGNIPTFEIPFEIGSGPFVVELCVKLED
jgi:chemotaxis protein CheX